METNCLVNSQKDTKAISIALLTCLALTLSAVSAETAITPSATDNQPTDAIVTVNDQALTRADYEREAADITTMMQARGVPSDKIADLLNSLKPRIVEGLVTRVLITQACEKNNIQITESEIAEKINKFEKKLSKPMTLTKLLEQSGLTQAMFENDIKEQLRLEKLLQIKDATDEEISAYYEEHKSRFFEQPEKIHARHILISFTPEDSADIKADKRARAEDLLKQLKEKDADFSKLAEENSDCPSKAMGGDLGAFQRGQMVKEFEDTAFAMQNDEISDLVETRFGYHIIQTLEHIPAKTQTLAEARDDIIDALKGRAIQDKAEVFFTELRQAAKITYTPEFDPELATPPAPFAPAPDATPEAAEPEPVEQEASEAP